MTVVNEKFEDVGFAGTGRGLQDDIFTSGQGTQGLLLPDVGYEEVGVRHGEFLTKDLSVETQVVGFAVAGFLSVVLRLSSHGYQ
jgi:hypothetical protein